MHWQLAKVKYGISSQNQASQVQAFFPGVKRSGREVDHSSSCSAKVKNKRSYTSAPPVYLHNVNRDSFGFFYIECDILQTCSNFDTALKRHANIKAGNVRITLT